MSRENTLSPLARQIYSLDTATKATTLLDTTPYIPDSLIFDSSGKVTYTVFSKFYAGTTAAVRVFNPSTSSAPPCQLA